MVDNVAINELTHQRIIHFVIENAANRKDVLKMEKDTRKAYLSTVCNLRLVTKQWCTTTTRLLREKRQPLLTLSFDKENSVDEEPEVKKYGKSLEKFINYMANPNWVEPNILPFDVIFMDNFFSVRENCESLKKFLINCGNGIIDMEIRLLENVLIPDMIFPDTTASLSFPLLTRLFIEGVEGVQTKSSLKSISLENCDNVTNLLEVVFNGAKDLQEFVFGGKHWDLLDFRLPTLPSSLKRICFTYTPTSDQLDVILRSNLSKLQVARLPFSFPFNEDMHTKILKTWKNTLKSLILCDASNNTFPQKRDQKIIIRFPVLEELEHFETLGIKCQLQAEGENCVVSDCFPKLKILMLRGTIKPIVESWCKNSSQQLNLISLTIQPALIYENMFMDSFAIRNLHQTYSNIRNLNLNVIGDGPDALKYIFENMCQLKELAISFSENFNENNNENALEAALLGLTPEEIEDLIDEPHLHNQIIHDDSPSIKMLTELTTLKISSPHDGIPYIFSDLLFKFGFLKMPNLMNLEFITGINASERMTETWRNQGRNIVYKE